MALGVTWIEDCGVPTTTTAMVMQHRSTQDPCMRKSNRARARSTLLSGALNFGVISELYENPHNCCILVGGLSLVS
jgi:hypothetical protein